MAGQPFICPFCVVSSPSEKFDESSNISRSYFCYAVVQDNSEIKGREFTWYYGRYGRMLLGHYRSDAKNEVITMNTRDLYIIQIQSSLSSLYIVCSIVLCVRVCVCLFACQIRIQTPLWLDKENGKIFRLLFRAGYRMNVVIWKENIEVEEHE